MYAISLAPYALICAAGIASAARQVLWTESFHGIEPWALAFNAAAYQSPSRARNTTFVAGKAKKADFFVSGKTIPLLNSTVQDSYAGLLPITGRADETRKLSFWYWPTSAPHGSKALSIWLNGGPGCSSLIGFLSEHGAFTFRPGEEAPTVNPYAWSTESDMLYVEQPVGVGFTSRPPDVKNEIDVAEEFYGFLQQFYSVFPELLRKQLYVTGESYAGFYVPYIAHRIVHASKAEKKALPIDIQGLLINDGIYSPFTIGIWAPLACFVVANQAIIGLNDSTVAAVVNTSRTCGLDQLMDLVTYPPKGPFPRAVEYDNESDCIQNMYEAYGAAQEANPCFDVNDITVKCPEPQDPIIEYFSRADVQEALNVAGFGEWTNCVWDVLRAPSGAITDDSPYTETLFPDLISALPRGLTLWHGLRDMNIIANGTRLTIQNLTWAGDQGFQREPTNPIIIDGKIEGIQHSERGLSYYEITHAGHLIPMNQPKVALEVFKTVIGKGKLVHTSAHGH